MVSIDMAKAFDSVSHSYLEKVYEFFGFGERIRRWLKVIGTNRKAFIILGNGNLSNVFNLGRGTAQGNSPSPFLYNLAAQILLWKIEYDRDLKGVYPTNLDLPQDNPVNTCLFAYENNKQTSKNESFADDSNNFLILEVQSVSRLKKILDDFRKLSGLACNVDKSYIMRIGDDSGEISQDILDIGFPFTNEITILGFILRNDETMVASNYEKIRTKITNIIRFWERFNLTVPGKITIYKTLLLPHINYVASILTPDNFYLHALEEIFEKFVCKGINIGRSKIYSSVNQGGLGLFKLDNFISALQCSWIRRAKVVNDNWKFTLRNLGRGDVLRPIDPKNNSIGIALRNILLSYEKFLDKFYTYQRNFLFDKLYLNSRYKTRDGLLLDLNFFEMDSEDNVKNLTWNNCLVNGEFADINQFAYITGITLNRLKYNFLSGTYRKLRKKSELATAPPQSLEEFFSTTRKGSKSFRKIFDYIETKGTFFSSLSQVKTFHKITESTFSTNGRWERNFSVWTINGLQNRVKVFLFKYYNNILGLGNRVWHIDPTRDPSCHFCKIENKLPAPLETFSHLFFDCPVTNKIIEKFCRRFFRVEVTREIFFCGLFSTHDAENASCNLILDILRYSLWQAKLNKSRISYFTIEAEIILIMESLTNTNRKINDNIINCPLICLDPDPEPVGRDAERDP